MIDSYWIGGEFESTDTSGRFQSGSRVWNKNVRKWKFLDPSYWKSPYPLFLLTPSLVGQLMEIIFAHEYVVGLFFIIPTAKKIEQLEITNEDNEQERRWWQEVTEKTTEEGSEEMGLKRW